MAGCVDPDAAPSIGANSIVNTRASVDHDCRIGETVHIAPGVTLSGAVTIGDGTHIGTGAVRHPGHFDRIAIAWSRRARSSIAIFPTARG